MLYQRRTEIQESVDRILVGFRVEFLDQNENGKDDGCFVVELDGAPRFEVSEIKSTE